MRYLVRHRTSYSYSAPVLLSHNQVHLVPRPFASQSCDWSRQHITPTPSLSRTWTDFFGNTAGFFVVDQPHRELTVHSESIVNVQPRKWIAADLSPGWETVRSALQSPQDETTLSVSQFRFPSTYITLGAELYKYAAPSFVPGAPLLVVAEDLLRRIRADFRYDSTATQVSTPLQQLLELRRGVCQDFAHLMIACLRAFGLAANYRSGYLNTEPPPGKEKLVGADASHAWLAVWCPSSGWVELDPTNNCLTDDRYVTVAWGRDFGDVSPVKGVVLGGGWHEVRVAVDVTAA
jgi:transglutaminase-like putative cysteine protease